MKRFKLEDYNDKYVMNCRTEEEAEIFTRFLHEQGKKWLDGNGRIEMIFWGYFKEKTCYNFMKGCYSDINFYEELGGYTILKFSDFDWSEEKTKGDTERILKNFEEVTEILKGGGEMTGIVGEFRKVEFINNDKVFDGKYEVIELEIPRGLYDKFKEHTSRFKNCRTNVDDYSIREIFFLASEKVEEFNKLVNKFNEKFKKKETLEELEEEYRKMASEYQFELRKINYCIRYNKAIKEYILSFDTYTRDITPSHITLDIDVANDLCRRMNEALERERKRG